MRLIITLILVGCCQACAYTAISGAALITTGKSLTDHTVSKLDSSDCNSLKAIQAKGDRYYCERNNPAQTYNRNSY